MKVERFPSTKDMSLKQAREIAAVGVFPSDKEYTVGEIRSISTISFKIEGKTTCEGFKAALIKAGFKHYISFFQERILDNPDMNYYKVIAVLE